MKRRTLTVAALAVLLVVAGCAGTSDTSPTVTPTDAGTPTATTPTATATTPTATATTTPTPAPASYPDGWSKSGVTDSDAALRAHYRAVLSGPSATVRYRSEHLATNGTATALVLRLDTDERRLFVSIDGREDHREAYFADGTLSRWSVRNETFLGRSNASFVRAAQSFDDRVLKSQLLLYRMELNDTVTRGGTTVFVYDVVDVYDNAVSGTYGAAGAASGRVAVTGRGRVLTVDTTVRYADGNVSYRYTQRRIGRTDVTTPDWARRS